MLLKTTIAVAIFGGVLVSPPAFSQENPIFSAWIGFKAIPFVESKSACVAQQDAAVQYDFRGSFRFVFDHRDSAELSYGYEREPRTYGSGDGFPDVDGDGLDNDGVDNDFDRMLTASVFTLPTKRRSPFFAAAAGALMMPDSTTAASTQARLRLLYGASAGFNREDRTPSREHRGHFYDAATLNLSGIDGLDRFTNRPEPSVVLGYSF